MSWRHGKEQRETHGPTTQINGLVVSAAQIEGQRLGCDPSAGRVVQYMARMLLHEHSTVACVHGDLSEDAATTGRAEALVICEIAAVEVDTVAFPHIDRATELLGIKSHLVHDGL